MNKFDKEHRYHHMGIPTTEVRPNVWHVHF